MSQEEWTAETGGGSLDISFLIPAGDDSSYIRIAPVDSFQDPSASTGAANAPIVYPLGSEPKEYIRYKLATELLPDSDNLIGIYLEVSYGRLSSHKKAFYTAIYYGGM
jgi:hypothetical protein